MTVREYVGARYVPLFMGDWDNTKTYEPLSIVQDSGNSYTSRQFVPVGVDISNSTYWAETGNYNAQVEAYRNEVLAFDGRIDAIEDALPIADFDSVNTVDAAIDAEATARANAISAIEDIIPATSYTSANTVKDAIDAIDAKFPVATANIADDAITYAKLDDAIEASIKKSAKRLKGANLVCIGDSYGRGVGGVTDHGWPYFIDQWANCNTITNVSNSGAGFVAEGHSTGLEGMTFADQITYAKTHLDGGISYTDVDIVIIAGGYNDHGEDGIGDAAYSCGRTAMTAFPNAIVHFYPLVAGDKSLNNEFTSSFQDMVFGIAETGVQVHNEALYWLYPYQIEASAGDTIHPNNQGYKYIAAGIMGTVNGGTYLPNTRVFAKSAEGFAFAADATNNDFRAFVQSGVAYFGGRIDRVGAGDLCTLPSYCRPRQTTYFLAFAYSDSTYEGIARIRVLTDGSLDFFKLETGTYDATKTYQVYIPVVAMSLGHTIF